MLATLIIGLIAGPAVSLNGSPTVSPVIDASCAGGALAAVRAVLDELLRVVPGAAARGHHHGEEEADDDDADQQAAERLDREDADDDRDDDRDQRRDDHLALRRARDDVHALAVLGLLRAVHDARLLAELPAHLLHDGAAGAADGLHGERGEERDHHAADDQADEHVRIVEGEEDALAELPLHLDLERREEHERGERGRADRVALGHGLRRVADRVERVGDVADLVRHVGHLGDAARVVRDRAERVERDDQAGQRQLRHHGHADAVDAGELVRAEDAEHDDERRQRRRLHALGEALDDVRRVAGLRRLRGRLDRREARRGVVVRDDEQRGGHAEADQRADVDVAPAGRVARGRLEREAVHHPRVTGRKKQRGEDARDDEALVERALHVAGGRLHGERADDRRDDGDAAEHERVEHDRALLLAREGEDAEEHDGHGGHRVGLEEVRGHAGAVADVVAHVVGDHGRVARVVLRDAGLDLADDVRADVGALGEDAAAEAGEDRDQRAAEAEADERVDRVLRVDVEDPGQEAVVAGDAEQREAGDEHAGHRAAAERDVERRAEAAAGRLRHAGVGADGHVHADEAGRGRQRRRRPGSRWRPRCPGGAAAGRTGRRRRWRSSCTGGGGTRKHPPGSPPTGCASSRCPARAPGANGS